MFGDLCLNIYRDQEDKNMPAGTLDIMKLAGEPVTYQVMFELNGGGTRQRN